jgi:hypothetical protein
MVTLDLLDKHGVGLCISKTSDIIIDVDGNFTCFSLKYDSALQEPVTSRYTNNLPRSVNFNAASVASQTPTLAQLNQYYNSTCGSSNGLNYESSGLHNCWGITCDPNGVDP